MKRNTSVTAQHVPSVPGLAVRSAFPAWANNPSTERLLRRPEVLRRTGLSRTSMYRLIQQGGFPSPVQLSAKSVAWPASAIDAWIASRIAAGRGGRGD